MLGIRLPEEKELELARHARAVGRGKSVVAREWILERLEKESIDAEMRRVSRVLAEYQTEEEQNRQGVMSDAFIRMLDEEDGGYDWGGQGPPA